MSNLFGGGVKKMLLHLIDSHVVEMAFSSSLCKRHVNKTKQYISVIFKINLILKINFLEDGSLFKCTTNYFFLWCRVKMVPVVLWYMSR